MKTSNYHIALLHQHQAHKEQQLNLSLETIDNIINKAIKGRVIELPEDAQNGDIYLFTKHMPNAQETIQARINDKWHEIIPQDNMIFYDISQKSFIIFESTDWKKI
jgi:hypothetical protein